MKKHVWKQSKRRVMNKLTVGTVFSAIFAIGCCLFAKVSRILLITDLFKILGILFDSSRINS